VGALYSMPYCMPVLIYSEGSCRVVYKIRGRRMGNSTGLSTAVKTRLNPVPQVFVCGLAWLTKDNRMQTLTCQLRKSRRNLVQEWRFQKFCTVIFTDRRPAHANVTVVCSVSKLQHGCFCLIRLIVLWRSTFIVEVRLTETD
jgi:hypothetical protein